MTDQSHQPTLDPNELRTVTLTNADISNLLQCTDLMRRQCQPDMVRGVLDLQDKLAAATPVAKPVEPVA